MSQTRSAGTNPGTARGRVSSAFQGAMRPEETAPGAELRDPADLVDELVFFARVLLRIPHHAIFRFPVRVDARRKHQNG
jgi:hypothetical protein